MSCGLSQYYAAIIGTIFMCFILSLIYFIQENNKKQKKLRKQAELARLDADFDDEV